jgi:hypothetical protein
MNTFRSDETNVDVSATPGELFDYLDDQAHLGSHMKNPSKMMMGGSMTYEFDEASGRAVGSVIKMDGSILGFRLFVEEVVTEHQRPTRKIWETRGQPRILIMGAYRMGFEITPTGARSNLRVFIRYDRPPSLTGRLLSPIFAPIYARWCVTRMATDAARHFS